MTKQKRTPRKAAVQKALKRKAKLEIKENLTQKILEQVNQVIESFKSEVASDFENIVKMVSTCYTNQHVLAKSAMGMDDQFAVLLRLTITRLNQLIELQNHVYMNAIKYIPEEERPIDPENHLIPTVDYLEVSNLFKEFDEFKRRPDFKELFQSWYTLADLKTLPPLPPTEVKEDAEGSILSEEPEVPYQTDAEIFGGDYGSERGNGPEEIDPEREEDSSAGSNEMPELRMG
jgi:hypothetical protein